MAYARPFHFLLMRNLGRLLRPTMTMQIRVGLPTFIKRKTFTGERVTSLRRRMTGGDRGCKFLSPCRSLNLTHVTVTFVILIIPGGGAMHLLTKRHLANEQQSTFVRQPSSRGIRTLYPWTSRGWGCPTSITEIGMLSGIAFCSRSTLIYGVIKLQRRSTLTA